MADTLTREAIAYGSQPLSPVPQYWDGATSYAKVQGINGATRVINYNSAGETFTGASPGSVQLTATSTVVISGSSTAVISGTATVNYSGSGTVEIVTSAGGTAYFSSANPAFIEVITSSGGTARFTTTNPGITGLVSGGTQANAWSANATITAGATSNTFDSNSFARVSAFGQVTNTASITITFEVSQDNSNFYNTGSGGSVTVTAGTTSPFNVTFQCGARYMRLTTSGVSATITATMAGK